MNFRIGTKNILNKQQVKESNIYKYREHALGYLVLEEIKTAPNVTYIAKLRNVAEESKFEQNKSEENKVKEKKSDENPK